MKWGICSLIYHRHGFEPFLENAARQGYTHVEMNCVKDYFCHFNALQLADSPEILISIKEALRRYSLKLSAVDCHGLFGAVLERLRYSEDYIVAGFKVARSLKCPVVITSVPADGMPWAQMIKSFRHLCRIADNDYGVRLAVEAEYGYAVGNRQSLRRLFDEVDHPALGLNMDPTHFVAAGEDPVAILREFVPQLMHVHLKEAETQPYRAVAYAGCENSPASRMLDELQRLNYEGVVSAETCACLNDDPEMIAAGIMNGIKKYLRRNISCEVCC